MNGKVRPLQAISIYSNNLGMCLATEFIDKKTNEIPTGPKLLKLFNLENVIVTFDALNTQEKTIKTIMNLNTNEIKLETRYYISNLSNNINEFSNAIRNEWAIENKMHWHLDFSFKEDSNSTIEKNAQKNLNIIRKILFIYFKISKRNLWTKS